MAYTESDESSQHNKATYYPHNGVLKRTDENGETSTRIVTAESSVAGKDAQNLGRGTSHAMNRHAQENQNR